ncbi:SUMF1/EgtB/PvdO family nonheme iron enzyme [Alkalinema sp. FACHB-956]|uniref:SUMF1/EgtB/PvdO family nonheme iron enzyme n=1 Tax=Alkalinema sp. FACHB-956 TaxID=2692768 RepID=UPI001F548C64|nr:SUMF1/EgtB/PvdO family nonheme iron enzyme [Alkalinema sp. FACHB-956]
MGFSTEAGVTPESLRQWFRQSMEQCRSLTLQLFEAIDRETLCCYAHPDFSPIGWHLGHIGYTEALWILEQLAQQPRPWPELRRLYAQDGLPKRDRVHLPDLPDILAYLQTIRDRVFAYLDQAPVTEQARLWHFLLQHESQHCETIAIILALQGQGFRSRPPLTAASNLFPKQVTIPAGPFAMGLDGPQVIDNESPRHWVDLPDYSIDAYPVTQGQYRAFIESGGYQRSEFWHPDGWQWLQTQAQTAPIAQPRYWVDNPAYDCHPVCGVSWYEADAYARFTGQRLPTEAEWEKAANWDGVKGVSRSFPWGEAWPTGDRANHSHHFANTTPVNQFQASQSAGGCVDLLGNVWEWTSSWFDGYGGFEPFPYRGYSQAYFDQAHRVLKGGSWATRPWAMRNSFRNWYHPWVREIFAGFRCVRDR